MDAVFTLKAPPAEFDVIREAMATASAHLKQVAEDKTLTPEDRRNARQAAVEIETVAAKLR